MASPPLLPRPCERSLRQTLPIHRESSRRCSALGPDPFSHAAASAPSPKRFARRCSWSRIRLRLSVYSAMTGARPLPCSTHPRSCSRSHLLARRSAGHHCATTNRCDSNRRACDHHSGKVGSEAPDADMDPHLSRKDTVCRLRGPEQQVVGGGPPLRGTPSCGGLPYLPST